MPPHTLGAIVALAVGYYSDKYKRRGIFGVVCVIPSIIGYILMIVPASASVHYLGCCLIGTGLYAGVVIPVTWTANNCPRYGKRAVATALQISVANCAGIAAPYIYPTKQGPRYVQGHAVTLAMIIWAASVYGFLWLYLDRVNANRDAGKEDHKLTGLSEIEVVELGNESPYFRYMT